MHSAPKLVRAERLLFTMLLVGMASAGYAYEVQKDAMQMTILLPLILVYLAALYLTYRILLKLAGKRPGK